MSTAHRKILTLLAILNVISSILQDVLRKKRIILILDSFPIIYINFYEFELYIVYENLF